VHSAFLVEAVPHSKRVNQALRNHHFREFKTKQEYISISETMSYEKNSFAGICEELRKRHSVAFIARSHLTGSGLLEVNIAPTRCMTHPPEPHVLVLGRSTSGSVYGTNQQLGF